nr:hypothetical protein [Bacillus thuringiensis]
MIDINPELIKLSATLGNLITQNSVSMIFDKVKATKANGSKDETISKLETIIYELISDKNQLIQIAQTYDEQLVSQKISEEDITYITTMIIPLLDEMLTHNTSEEAENLKNSLDMIKPLLSKETFNILQLLGFNFKQAIGEPLTMLIRGIISSKIPGSLEQTIEYRTQNEIKQIEYFKVLQDEKAFQRFQQSSQEPK